MENLLAIDKTKHNSLKIYADKLDVDAMNTHLLPIVMSEINHVVTQSPVLLSKNAETGQFTLVTLMGFNTGENLFCDNGKWTQSYLPLHIQRQPFFVGQESGGENEHIICINKHSPLLVPPEVKDERKNESLNRIFDDNGQETEFFTHIKGCLAELLAGEQENLRFIDSLKSHDLIKPVSLKMTFLDGAHYTTTGLYTVDLTRLHQLSEPAILELFKHGYLNSIYVIASSLSQVYPLIARKNDGLSGTA